MFVFEFLLNNVKTIRHGERATEETEFVSLYPRESF